MKLKRQYKIHSKLNLKFSKNENKNLRENSLLIIKTVSQILTKKNIDMCIILGDRYEAFLTAVACTINNIKIAHVHGGELSEGSKDDTFRHSITKMSNLHFVATNIYKNRVLQLGEDPKHVFNFGALCNDTIRKIKFLNKKTFFKKTI